MGRHAATAAGRRPVQLTPQLLIALAVATVVLLAAGLTVWAVDAAGGGCERTTVVRVTVAPELAPVAERVLTDAEGLRPADCAAAEVTAQEPVQTVGDLGALDAASLPHVWVPDSSLWTARAEGADLQTVGQVASSPVVLATSAAAVDELGWRDGAPGWAEAMGGPQAIAVPDLAASAEAIAALGAVRTALGGDEDADNAVVQTVLAAERGPSVSPAEALAAGSAGDADAPLVPVSEQQVWAAGAGGEDAQLVAVHPAEGSPVLDHPLVRVGSAPAPDAAAVDAVVRALTSDAARSAVVEAGFRDPGGAAPAGVAEQSPGTLQLDPAEVQALLAQLAELAAPSRILTVFDVSLSMEAPAGDGTRATLARDAARSTLTLVPDGFALGLWFFAAELDGERDWTEVVPTRELAAEAEGSVQRDLLDEQLAAIPDRLDPGGTGLYDTTLDAVRAARADFDPTAVNSVLLVTDGANEDSRGIGLEELLSTLRDEADPDRPVKVIGVALGPDADLSVLEQVAEVTGGEAYSAVDPTDLQTVLFDALRQR
ncbi:VWA domain-containing protein [Geodermatophilus sp. DSM 44513]|uniref:VWA domain-containing protein n=1 Tax=Geodermatophilus sp. DSM 44513 TaxID=1528104 RepID=UPI00127F7E85|nr:VWA domain-containing protein [Geodermatophilus sp. DSM 44513]WNV76067.1 VWA domain-containing protein [Geodermatophilus sp. DSM 44513]